MFDIERIFSFVIAATLVIIVPGPATLYIMNKAHMSIKKACYAALGIILGDVILIILSGLGFSAFIIKWPILISLIKLIGGLYIIYLGIELLKAVPIVQSVKAVNKKKNKTDFFKGITITLTNPKPIIFFSAFFPMFINPMTQTWIKSFYALGVLFEIINFIYFSFIILIITQLRTLHSSSNFIKEKINKISGYGLIIISFFILISVM